MRMFIVREHQTERLERDKRIINRLLRQWFKKLRDGYAPKDRERAEIRDLIARKNAITDELKRMRLPLKDGRVKWAGASSVPPKGLEHKPTENASTRLATYGMVPMSPRIKLWN